VLCVGGQHLHGGVLQFLYVGADSNLWRLTAVARHRETERERERERERGVSIKRNERKSTTYCSVLCALKFGIKSRVYVRLIELIKLFLFDKRFISH